MVTRKLRDIADPFAAFIFAVILSALLILCFWLLASYLIAPLPADEVGRRIGFLPGYVGLIKPEPVESIVFVAGFIISALIITCAAFVAPAQSSKITSRTSIFFLLAAATAWLFCIDWSTINLPNEGFLVRSALQNLFWFALTSSLLATVMWAFYTRSHRWFLASVVTSAPLIWMLSPVIFDNQDFYAAYTHYEVFVYPIIQEWLGSHLYLGTSPQKSQYGMYAIFLRPLWELTGGPTTSAITSVMYLLLVFSASSVVCFAARFSRRAGVGASFALVGICFSLFAFMFWPNDAYFEFFPVRMLFPAIACWLLICRATRENHPFLGYLVLSFGILWNFESGIASIAMFGTFQLALRSNGLWSAAKVALIHASLASAAIAFAIFCLWGLYLAAHGEPPAFKEIIRSVTAFSAGVGAEPMSPFGAWSLYALTYAATAFIAIRRLAKPASIQERLRCSAMISAAVVGAIWLKYYQGRSLPLPLTLVGSHVFVCAGLVLGNLPFKWDRWTAPAAAALSASIAVASALWVGQGIWPNRGFQAAATSPTEGNWGTVATNVADTFRRSYPSGGRLLVLAPFAHLTHLALGEPSPLHSAGLCQIWFQDEADEIVAILQSTEPTMVVTMETTDCQPSLTPDARIAELLRSNFTLSSTLVDSLGKEIKIYERKGG